ncbi:MAG: galactokinase [Negativicutes bacterium]|nr:galactokinase [Negativicutes bacterium]
MDQTLQIMLADFLGTFGGNADGIRCFFAPGRINLIGEHTDYNGGYVLPVALEIGSFLLARPRRDRLLRLADSQWPQPLQADLDHLTDFLQEPWGSYQLAIAHILQRQGCLLQGCDLYYHETVPLASGLSSSAAIELVTATALNRLNRLQIPPLRLAELAQTAECDFIGVQCGIMDQFAAAMGKANHALLLRCSDLRFQAVPLHLGDYRLLIVNSNYPRSLLQSKYNQRRQECEAALAMLQRALPQAANLAAITPRQFAATGAVLQDSLLFRRARHVISENARVLSAAAALTAGDLVSFGLLLNASHRSLRDDYEVTGAALDCLAETAQNIPGVLGARMTGAGFGGCTINLLPGSQIEAFQAKLSAVYQKKTGRLPSFYPADSADGAHEIDRALL